MLPQSERRLIHTTAALAESNRRRLDALREPVPDTIPVKITAVSDGEYTWVKVAFDAHGQPYDDPTAFGGDETYMPLREMNGGVLATFPHYARAWQRVIATDEGSGSGGGADIGMVMEFDAAGAASSVILVVLTHKEYDEDTFQIVYTAYRVTPYIGDDGKLAYAIGDALDADLYHERNEDLVAWEDFDSGSGSGSGSGSSDPVPGDCVHEVWLSDGFYLFASDPRVDFIYKELPEETETIAGITYVKVRRLVYDQTEKAGRKLEYARRLDMSDVTVLP